MKRRIEVPEGAAGARIDVVIAEALDGLSRSRIQRMVKGGSVTVDGTAARRPSATVAAGAVIELDTDDAYEVSTDVSGAVIDDLDVLHQDEHVAVVHKPAGLLTHPSSRQRGGTLADLAVQRFGALPQVQGEDRPGIVHRLDRLTSGVMVLGLTTEALEHLKAQFKDRTVEKTYHAVVHGNPRFDSDWLTGAIESSPKSPDRMRVVPEHLREERLAEGARVAETFLERVEDFRGGSLVAAHPKTGRTHQIRVHLQAAGLPIVGDRAYGPRGGLREPLPKGTPVMERPALHARRLTFDHPVSGERMTFEAPLPEDMERLLAFLRGA